MPSLVCLLRCPLQTHTFTPLCQGEGAEELWALDPWLPPSSCPSSFLLPTWIMTTFVHTIPDSQV